MGIEVPMLDDDPKNFNLNMKAQVEEEAIRAPSFGTDIPKSKPVPK